MSRPAIHAPKCVASMAPGPPPEAMILPFSVRDLLMMATSLYASSVEKGMAAHDRADLLLVETAQEIVHGVAHGVVVKGAPQRLTDVVAMLALLGIVHINARVEAGGETLLVLGVIAFVKGISSVELAPESIVNASHPGEYDTGLADLVLHSGRDLAAEEAAVGETVACSDVLRDEVEIYILENIPGDEAGAVGRGQFRYILDFLVGIGHVGSQC